MKKRICISVWVLFFIFFLILLVNYISNERMISKYNRHVYEFNNLWFLGFTQPYISPYNKGNIYFRKGEYELAIAQYDEALEKWPTKNAECDIRVNKALSMLKLIDVTVNTKADVDPIIDQLLLVEEVLTVHDCANIDKENGHDADAQNLFNEIDEYIDVLAEYKDTFTYYGQKIFKDDRGNDRELGGKDFEFSFIEVADADGNELAGAEEVISTNEADGFITFVTITYQLEDAGTHYYRIKEIEGDNPYIEYSDKEYIVQIDLTLSYNKRTLDSVITYYADDPIATQIKFGNIVHIPDEEPQGGGGSGDGDSGGGSGEDPDNGGGGNEQDPSDPNPEGDDPDNGGETQPEEVDPIEQQLQEYMNQANEERNDDLNYDQTHDSHYYGDDIW